MDLSFVSCYVYLLNTVSTYIVAISSYWDDIDDVIISTILLGVDFSDHRLKTNKNI